MIEITIREVRNLVMFHQVDSEQLYDKDLGIVKIDL